MEKQNIIDTLYQTIENYGLMPTMKRLGAGIRIQLPFSQIYRNVPIEVLNLTVRSYNGLKRSGIETVNELIDYINQEKLLTIRNLGKNSNAEIKVRVYEYGYNCLTEKEKKDFIKNLLDLNKNILY